MFFAALFWSLSLLAYANATSLLIPVAQGDKRGYIDAAGKVVIGFRFDSASGFHEGLAEVELDDKCGYIDRSGKLVIPYQRCYLFGDFQEGFAVVSFKKRGKERFMDPRGKLLHGAAFAFTDSFSDGLAAVKPRREGTCCWGYVGRDGRFVIPPKFEDFAGRFSEGVAYVRLGGKIGFINRQGEFVIPPQFEQADDFSEGLAPVQLGGKWGFIDHEGRVVIPPQFSYARSFSEGLAVAYAAKDKAGYIDRQGQWVVEPKYRQATPFREGYGEVVNGWVGFVDRSGKEVLPVQYSEGSHLGQGLFSVLTANHDGVLEGRIMDLSGKIIYRYPFRRLP